LNNQEQHLAAARFLALLRPIQRDLENYSRRMVFDRRDFEDALQNAVLRAFRAFDRYHDDASFKPNRICRVFATIISTLLPTTIKPNTRCCAHSASFLRGSKVRASQE